MVDRWRKLTTYINPDSVVRLKDSVKSLTRSTGRSSSYSSKSEVFYDSTLNSNLGPAYSSDNHTLEARSHEKNSGEM